MMFVVMFGLQNQLSMNISTKNHLLYLHMVYRDICRVVTLGLSDV